MIDHRYRVGEETVYVDPTTGKRDDVRILSVLREDDGSPIYGVLFVLGGRTSCVVDGDLIPCHKPPQARKKRENTRLNPRG